MIVLPQKPPNFEQIAKVFPIVRTQKGIVYTYGGVIFNPDSGPIDECLGLHESTHSLQQDEMGDGETGPKAWWDKYLHDPQFRLEQEIEAYQNQYRRFCELYSDRNKQARELMRLARDVSSPQYGNIISYQDALREIRLRADPRI